MTDISKSAVLCPSATATSGALLIASVAPDGRLIRLGTPLTIDDAFVEKAIAYGPCEQRFRFASPCQERNCLNWAGSACGVITELHHAATEADVIATGQPLPQCQIRSHCRWWLQQGREACSVCSLVVTDSTC
jgi:hypothetical protein